MLRKEKQEILKLRMEQLGIRDEDLIEKFIMGTGKGGQKVNKTSSCVYLKHLPTGIEVKCQESRSRAINRLLARRHLCDNLEEQIKGIQTHKQQQIEKIRRQKRKRSKRAQEKVLEAKKRHASKKSNRKAVDSSFDPML